MPTEVDFGERSVPGALQADEVILHLQMRLAQIGTIGYGFIEEILHRADLIGGWDFESRGGNEAGGADGFVLAAGQHVFENGFFLFEEAAGIDQILLGREDLRVGAGSLHGGERALVHLGFRIGEEFLGGADGFLLHLFVFVKSYEIGIEADYAVNCRDELLLEQHRSDAALVGGDADEAVVEAAAEATQQRLGEVEPQARTGIRVIGRVERVGRLVIVIEVKTGLAASHETLLDAGIGGEALRHQRRRSVSGWIRYGRSLVVPVHLAYDRGIEDRHGGSVGLRDCALHRIIGLGLAKRAKFERVTRNRGSVSGGAGGGRIGDERAKRSADASGDFRERVVQTAYYATALRAQEFGVALGNGEALEFDIEVVFDG